MLPELRGMCNAEFSRTTEGSNARNPDSTPSAPPKVGSVLMDKLLDEAVDELYHDANDGQGRAWQKDSFAMNRVLGEVYDDEEAGEVAAFGGEAGLRDTFQLKKEKPGHKARDSFQLHKRNAGILRDSFTNHKSHAKSSEPKATPQAVFQEAATKAQLFGSLDEMDGNTPHTTTTTATVFSSEQCAIQATSQHNRNPSTIAQLLQMTPSCLFGDALCENIVIDAMLHDESKLMRNIVRRRCGMGRLSDTCMSRSSRRSWERGAGITTSFITPSCSEKYAAFMCERFRHHMRVAMAEGKCDYLELRIAMEQGYLTEISSEEAEKKAEEEEQERQEHQRRLFPEEKEAITAVLSMSRKNKKLYNDYDLYDVEYECKIQRTAELCGEGSGFGRRWGTMKEAVAERERKNKKSNKGLFGFFSSKSSSSFSSPTRKQQQQQQAGDTSADEQSQQKPRRMEKHVRIDTPRNVEFINPRKPKFGGWRSQP